MALQIFGFNGWDTTTLRRRFTCDVTGSYPRILPTSGPRSGPCLNLNTFSTASIALGGSVSNIAIGFRLYVEAIGPSDPVTLLTFFAGASYQFAVRFNESGTLSVGRRSSVLTYAAPLGTTPTAIPIGEWHHVGLLLTISNTIGIARVFIDGIEDLTLQNQDTQAHASIDTVDAVMFGGDGSTAATWRMADLYLKDTTSFLGVGKITGYVPTADGHYTELTPSAGANWECVDDEFPNDDTDTVYGEAGTDTYTHAELDHTPDTILGVKVECVAKDDDASGHTLTPMVRSAGTDSAGNTVGLSVSEAVIESVWETDPATSAAWTKAGFDAAEFGMEIA